MNPEASATGGGSSSDSGSPRRYLTPALGLLEQVEPDLAARRERRHGVAQPRDRDLADDRDRGRVQEVLDLRSGERRADQHAALAVDHEPARAWGVASPVAAAGVAAGLHVDDLDVDLRLLGR